LGSDHYGELGARTMSEEQPGTEPKSREELASLRREVEGLHKRMEEIRAATEVEILKNWQSPWKGADTVKAKVDARLASSGWPHRGRRGSGCVVLPSVQDRSS